MAVECCDVQAAAPVGKPDLELFEVWAVGADRVRRRFLYTCSVEQKLYNVLDPRTDFTHWEFSVWQETDSPGTDEAGYRAIAVEVGELLAINIGMYADKDDFRRLGLPEAMIGELARQSGLVICSSSNRQEHHRLQSEYRNCEGEKVWRRLQKYHRAAFDPTIDRFVYLGEAPNPGPQPDDTAGAVPRG